MATSIILALAIGPLSGTELAWKAVGFAGIGVFGTRFLVQWVHSERHGESRVPPIFWWQSLIGTALCLAYFLREREIVGVTGYVLNVIPYTRNLMLVYRKQRTDLHAPAAAPVAPAAPDAPAEPDVPPAAS